MQSVKSCQLLNGSACGHAFKRPVGARRILLSRPITARSECSEQTGDSGKMKSKMLSKIAYAAAIAPLLLPLPAFCQEQLERGEASLASPEVVRLECSRQASML